MIPNYAEYRYEPLRAPACLIIGPFNYPFQLTLVPALGSLSAGNPTVIKPSELCPATSTLLSTLIPKYFEQGALQGNRHLLLHLYHFFCHMLVVVNILGPPALLFQFWKEESKLLPCCFNENGVSYFSRVAQELERLDRMRI